MRKLYEYRSYDNAHIVLEDVPGENSVIMKGVFIQGEVKNQNQRIYPLEEITSAVQTINEKLLNGESVLGELDHPEELSINLDRVSHVIKEMYMDGNDGIGSLKIIDTPMGQIAKTLLKSGAKLGVSSRGSGNVGYDGKVSDFSIVTVDIVAQPSAPGAYPKTIYESLYNMEGGSRVYDTANGVVHNDPVAKKYLQKEILRFINELKI